MRPIQKIRMADGSEREARELDFDIAEEPWCRYKLKDGGEVRIRITARTVFHLMGPDSKPAYSDSGEPDLWVNYTPQIVGSL